MTCCFGSLLICALFYVANNFLLLSSLAFCLTVRDSVDSYCMYFHLWNLFQFCYISSTQDMALDYSIWVIKWFFIWASDKYCWKSEVWYLYSTHSEDYIFYAVTAHVIIIIIIWLLIGNMKV